MSDAKKCDRCGRFYDIYGKGNNAVGFRFVNKCDATLQPIYDLCPDCVEELKNWLANPVVKILYPYAHVAYSNSSDGTLDFSTTDMNGRKYVGICQNYTKEDSEDPSDYVWCSLVWKEKREENSWQTQRI